MAQDYSKWWNKFSSKALDIIGDRPYYFKEKYGRFDVTVFDGLPDELFDRIINEVEEESCKCCQRCAKHRKQFWTNGGWIEHFCLPCYIMVMAKNYWKKFIYKIQMIGRKIN